MRVFENEYFLVVDKRPGWLSVPSRLGAQDERHCEVTEWRKETGLNLLPVHRIDQEVSGILAFAKSPDSHRAANVWFENREVTKTYEAIAENAPDEPPQDWVVWKSLLLRGKRRAYEKPFGKPSQTRALYKGNFLRGMGLWELNPITGRPHQLRFEMAKRGYPVWGDELYGAASRFPIEKGIGLRAVSISFAACADRESWGLPAEIRTTGIKLWLDQSSESRSSK